MAKPKTPKTPGGKPPGGRVRTVSRGRRGTMKLSKSGKGKKQQKKDEEAEKEEEAEEEQQEEENGEEEEEEQDNKEEENEEEEPEIFKCPIRKDGYIPNSVVRQFFEPEPEPQPIANEKDSSFPWRLKPVPGMDEIKKMLDEEEERARSEYLKYQSSRDTNKAMGRGKKTDGTLLPEGQTSSGQPMIFDYQDEVVETMSHGGDPSSRASSAASKELSKKKKKIKIGKVTVNKIDMDLDVWGKSKKKKPQPQDDFTEEFIPEEEDDGIPPVIKRIVAESWFPKNMPSTVQGVVLGFIAIMHSSETMRYKEICSYIIQIHQELSYSPEQMNRLVNRLLEQLKSDNALVRATTIRTLKELGVKKDMIIQAILPMLADPDAGVRQEAADAVKVLAGIHDKDDLLRLLESIGHAGIWRSDMDEQQVLTALAERLAGSDSEMNTKGMQKWLKQLDQGDKDPVNIHEDLMTIKGKGRNKGSKKQETRKRANEKEKSTVSKKGGTANVQPAVKTPRKRTEKSSVASNSKNNNDNLTKISLPGHGSLPPGDEQWEELTQRSQTSGSDHAGSEARDDHKERLLPNSVELYRFYEKQEKTRTGDLVAGGTIEEVEEKSYGVDTGLEESSAIDPDKNSTADEVSSLMSSVRLDDDSGLGVQSSDGSSTGYLNKPGYSLVSRGEPGLSPVKSVADVEEEPVVPPDNWREFFDRPTAQARKKQLEDSRRDDSSPRQRSVNLPPIQYIGQDMHMVPGDPGQRLLHSITVNKNDDSASDDSGIVTRRRRVNPIPGKLAINTGDDDTGSSKFGILNMKWTTEVPALSVPQTRNRHKSPAHRTNSQFPQLSKLQSMRASGEMEAKLESASRSVPIRPVEGAVDDRFLPNITRTHAHPDSTRAAAAAHGETDGRRAVHGEVDEFTWEKPMPPAPGTESHRHSRSGGHHCEYTRLLKKGMHTHTSKEHRQFPCKESYRGMKHLTKYCQGHYRLIRSMSRCNLGQVVDSPLKLPPVTLRMMLTGKA